MLSSRPQKYPSRSLFRAEKHRALSIQPVSRQGRKSRVLLSTPPVIHGQKEDSSWLPDPLVTAVLLEVTEKSRKELGERSVSDLGILQGTQRQKEGRMYCRSPGNWISARISQH